MRTRHDEVVASHQLALPHEEDLHPRLISVRRQGNQVECLRRQVEHLLPLVHLLDGLYLIPQRRRPLEFELLGRLQHSALKRLQNPLGLTIEEEEDLLDDLPVLLFVHRADARPDASVDVEVEAGARIVARDRLRARPVREEFFQKGQSPANAARAGERPEVPGAIALHRPRDVDLREFLRQIDLDERIALVVLEPRVIGRLVLLDEVAFEEEGFLLRLCHDVFEFGDARDHLPDLRRVVRALGEVRTEPVPQLGGLADVKDSIRTSAHEVDAGSGRHGSQSVGKIGGHQCPLSVSLHRWRRRDMAGQSPAAGEERASIWPRRG